MRRAEVLPAMLLFQIEEYFKQLEEELGDETGKEFRLDHNGYIVVLEAGDNVRDLGNVGLNHDEGGLLGSYPEYVEMIDLEQKLKAYKIVILYNNDYLMTFFTQSRVHDKEVEQWLRYQAERN